MRVARVIYVADYYARYAAKDGDMCARYAAARHAADMRVTRAMLLARAR